MTMPSGSRGTHVDDVVAVELTIDGMLVVADRLHMMEFPPALGIRPNIPQLELRDIVWEQVARDLTSQGVLDVFGAPHPEVAAMVDTLSRADRTLECRWWRRDVGGKMVRFAVCRKGDRHVIAARDGDMIVLQRIAPQVGLAGMVTAVLGTATPADVEPLTGVASKLGQSTTPNQLAQFGVDPPSARLYADITAAPSSWVEITANERHPGGTYSHSDVAAGVLDSRQGRIVSLPRRVNGELYGSLPLLGGGAAGRGDRDRRSRIGGPCHAAPGHSRPGGLTVGPVAGRADGSTGCASTGDRSAGTTHRGHHADAADEGGWSADSKRDDARPAVRHAGRCAIRAADRHPGPAGSPGVGPNAVAALRRGAAREQNSVGNSPAGGRPAGPDLGRDDG
jgi:hypothetical protein